MLVHKFSLKLLAKFIVPSAIMIALIILSDFQPDVMWILAGCFIVWNGMMILDWWLDRLEVHDDKIVISEHKAAILGSETQTLRMSQIATSRVSKNFLGTLFGYGVVHIETSGESDMAFGSCRHPESVVDYINEKLDAHRPKRRIVEEDDYRPSIVDREDW